MSIGEASGRAVLLPFAQDANRQTAGGRVPVGANAGARYQGQSVDDADMELLLGGKHEPIMLDAAGMDDEYFRSIDGLRQYAIEMRSNYGIDVTGAPDPRNPQAREAQKLWTQAVSQHRHNTERLRQAKGNQDLLNREYLAGNTVQTKESRQPGFGPITGGMVQDVSFPLSPQFLSDYNVVLNRDPETQEDMDALTAYREQAIADIERHVAESGLPEAAARFYASRLAPVKSYDDRMTQAKIASEEALAAQRLASRNAENALAESRRAETKRSGGEGGGMVDPALVRVAAMVSGPVNATMPAGVAVDNEILAGTSFQGKGQYLFETMVISPDGTAHIFYKPPQGYRETINETDLSTNTNREITTIIDGGKRIRVSVSRDDISSLPDLLFPQKKADEQKALLKDSYKDGKLPAASILSAPATKEPETITPEEAKARAAKAAKFGLYE
jgi:hypothetical protein